MERAGSLDAGPGLWASPKVSIALSTQDRKRRALLRRYGPLGLMLRT